MKKGCGITLLVFAALNFIVALAIAGGGATADAVGQKFAGAFLLAIIGGALYYYGTRKKDDKQVKPTKADVPLKEAATPVPQKAFSSSVDDDYESLFDELKAKCHPKQFMELYDHEKVKVANELYARILKVENDKEKQNELRQEAVEKLGVKFSSRRLYDKLISLTNPANFMNPYDAEKVAIANDYYQRVQQSHENAIELEALWEEIKEEGMLPFRVIKDEHSISSKNNETGDIFAIGVLILVGAFAIAILIAASISMTK